MSRGDLQEMEQSKTAVNANAKPADPMQTLAPGAVAGQSGSYEDLGGPTPENYKPDDDSAKLREPKIKTVKDVVNKGAKPAEAMSKMSAEEVETQEDTLEEEILEDEVVAEEETAEEGFDIEEDVNALLGGEDLSEEFKEKAKTIFEAALNSKVKEIEESLAVQYEQALAEEIEEMKVSLQERVDTYLEYVAEEWLVENQLAVEHGLKTEMTESFLQGMKGLFEEHYVTIPEDRYDVLESMVNKLDEMEEKLNEQIERNVALNKRLAESVTDGILGEVSEGLAVTQKEKLASLSESVEFDSEEDYREKLVTLREAYFPSRVSSAQRDSAELISEESSMPQVSGSMEGYLSALQRVSKK